MDPERAQPTPDLSVRYALLRCTQLQQVAALHPHAVVTQLQQRLVQRFRNIFEHNKVGVVNVRRGSTGDSHDIEREEVTNRTPQATDPRHQ